WMFLLFSVLGAPNVGGCTEHRSSRFTYTFSLSPWMTKNVNGFEYLRLCEGRDRYLCSELYMTLGPLVLPPSQCVTDSPEPERGRGTKQPNARRLQR
ncbi:hypothetical protein HaLaN_24826, partial [Haematococcus lacustris]